MKESKQYWFPAKRYGWGWGMPDTWQGWLVILGFALSAVVGIFLFPPEHDVGGFVLYFTGITVVLIGVCYAKGEPPAWRWGKK
jgi:hypothetical protein